MFLVIFLQPLRYADVKENIYADVKKKLQAILIIFTQIDMLDTVSSLLKNDEKEIGK